MPLGATLLVVFLCFMAISSFLGQRFKFAKMDEYKLKCIKLNLSIGDGISLSFGVPRPRCVEENLPVFFIHSAVFCLMP